MNPDQKNDKDRQRFSELTYEDFKKMALDPSLSAHEKIGFPDEYREGYEDAIYCDICAKLTNLGRPGAKVLDIGPGCSELTRRLIAECGARNQELVLVDSSEMLSLLPDKPGMIKIAGSFPECHERLSVWAQKFDVILSYSVLQYVFVEANFWGFLDRSIQLLSPGGQMLVGDIPNVSKRKRFFGTESGVRFHQQFMHTTEVPKVEHHAVEHDKIDDAVILSILMRARAEGCDAYWLPQPESLPMFNRREDVLICKP